MPGIEQQLLGLMQSNLGQYQQQQMAQEQWQMQKQLYEQQIAASKQGASGLSSLVNEYNKAFAEAKTANEQRYQQLLGIANNTTSQRAADIQGDYARQAATQQQGLARLGMANTTIAPTLQAGTEREKQASLNRLADEMQGTKLGIIERKTDSYPDMGIITALASSLGQSGVGLGSMASGLSGLKLG